MEGQAPCVICRCEEVPVDEVETTIAEGALTVNDVKRRTRAGMGLCQGIYCVPAVANLLAARTGQPLDQIAPMTARPPARLVPVGTVGLSADLSGQPSGSE